VQSILRQDPFSGTVFVFRSKRADRVKLLVYDGTGAHSGEGDRPFRPKMITDSGDRDHADHGRERPA
jgi:hypothetical protein